MYSFVTFFFYSSSAHAVREVLAGAEQCTGPSLRTGSHRLEEPGEGAAVGYCMSIGDGWYLLSRIWVRSHAPLQVQSRQDQQDSLRLRPDADMLLLGGSFVIQVGR